MEEIRVRAIQRVGELGDIKFKKPTAMELRSPRTMLSRVRHKEMKRHEQAVIRQKAKVTRDISNIDKYLQSVSDYEAYIASKDIGIAPVVLTKPNVVLGVKPKLRRTRLLRYKQRVKRR